VDALLLCRNEEARKGTRGADQALIIHEKGRYYEFGGEGLSHDIYVIFSLIRNSEGGH
jgi:hypothetical protein